MATVTRPFRGVNADQRVQDRRNRLIAAGLDEVAEVGVTGLRMNTVCRRARLSQRYFYEHFANRDELLAALFDDVMRDVFTQTLAAVDACGPDIVERASAALAVFYDVIINDVPRARLYAESAGVAAVAARKRVATDQYVAFVTEQVAAVVGSMDDRTAGRLAMATRVLVGGQVDAAIALAAGDVVISRADYIALCARMLSDAIAAAAG